MAWIDLVPGGRAALQYIQAKATAFLTIGPQLQGQLAEADRVWNTLPAPPPGGRSAAQLLVLNRWVQVRNTILADIAEWKRLEPAVRWAASLSPVDEPPTLPPALGVWPVALLIGAVTLIVTVNLALKQWLDARPTRVAALQQLMSDSVAAGLITPADAADVIDAGGRGGWSEDLTGLLKWGAIAVGGVILLQTLLPPPRRRR